MSAHLPAQSRFALTRRELVVLVLIFVASLPAVTTRVYSSDEIEYFAYLRSIWFDHDVSFENEYRYFHDRNVARAEGFHETFLERETEAGRRRISARSGAHCCELVLRRGRPDRPAPACVGQRRRRGRVSPPYIAAVAYASALYGFLAVLLTIDAARRVLTSSPDLKVGPTGASRVPTRGLGQAYRALDPTVGPTFRSGANPASTQSARRVDRREDGEEAIKRRSVDDRRNDGVTRPPRRGCSTHAGPGR